MSIMEKFNMKSYGTIESFGGGGHGLLAAAPPRPGYANVESSNKRTQGVDETWRQMN